LARKGLIVAVIAIDESYHTDSIQTKGRPEETTSIIPLRRDDLSDIHFPIAAQKVFPCTEAARCAPEGEEASCPRCLLIVAVI
jgi:hypothetical protein